MKVNYMLMGHDCAQEFNTFLKFGISIRDERVLSRIVHWSRIVERSSAIRAGPILVQDERGSLPKLSWPVDYPTTIREKFFRPSALSLQAAWHCGTRNKLHGRFCREFEWGPARDRFSSRWFAAGERLYYRRALKTVGAHTVHFFALNLVRADWRARRERRRSRLNEWASEVYLNPVSRERDNLLSLFIPANEILLEIAIF